MTYRDLMRLANGYAESKVLLVANELGLFTAIGQGGKRADSLATACGASREGMDLLLQALAGLGLVRLKAGRYWNTTLGLKYLDGRSPTAVTNLLWLLNHHWSDWTGMARAVRLGRSGWASVTKTAAFRQRFALAMHERSYVLAPRMLDRIRLPRGARRLLDVGGGSGAYSIALAQRHSDVHVLLVDQAVSVARRHIKEARLAERIVVRQGNVLTVPLDSGFDLVLISNLLHDFSEAENRGLLRRAHGALRPGGKIVIVEYFLNAAGTLPAEAAVFSLLMYAFTPTGRSYAWNDVEAWLRVTGFGRFRRRLVTDSIGTLEAVRL